MKAIDREVMVQRKGVMAVAIALVAALLLAACGGGSDNSSSSGGSSGEKEGGGGTITIQGQSVNDHGTKDVSSEKSVEVEMDDYYFEPTVITGTPKETLTLELKNEGSATHTFTLPLEGIDKKLSPGASATVQVTIPDQGETLFFCKFHQTMGMAGALKPSS